MAVQRIESLTLIALLRVTEDNGMITTVEVKVPLREDDLPKRVVEQLAEMAVPLIDDIQQDYWGV